MATHPIERDPDKLGGQPVLRGTRIPVAILFDYLRTGKGIDEFLAQYDVERRLVEAVIDRAEQALNDDTASENHVTA
jgi:uncharacterized protein (DUF433 family)